MSWRVVGGRVTWIRVDTHLSRQHEMLTFRERLGVPFVQAVGHRILIETWVAENQWDGDLRRVPNEQLDAAGLWRGEPDVLALSYRDCFCDELGRIEGWFDRQGKLIAWKEANRRRKAASRSPDDRGQSRAENAGQGADDGGRGAGHSGGNGRGHAGGNGAGMDVQRKSPTR